MAGVYFIPFPHAEKDSNIYINAAEIKYVDVSDNTVVFKDGSYLRVKNVKSFLDEVR